MQIKQIIIPLVLLPLLLTGCGGGGSGDKTIAEFDGKRITESAYLKRLETLGQVTVVINGQTVNAPLAEPLSAQALRSLMAEETLLELAREQGLFPSKDEVAKEKEFNEKLRPNYTQSLQELGYRLEDIDRQIQIELCRFRLLTDGVPEKAMADAEKFIEENPQMFTQPASVKFRWLVVPASEMKKVDEDLGKGLTFGAVASKYSIVPDAQITNGSFPPRTKDPMQISIESLRPELKSAAEKTAERQVSAWFEYAGNRAKIYVESKTPSQLIKLNDAQKEQVRRQLMLRDGIGNELDKKLLEKILEAEVKVIPNYLRKTWEAYRTQLKDAQAEMLGKVEVPKEKPTEQPKEGNDQE